MPIKSYRPTTPTRRFQTTVLRDEITRQQPERVAGPRARATRAGATARARSRSGSAAAATSGATGRSISSATRSACRPRWRRSNTIRTARRTWRCCTIVDGEKRYILQPAGLKVGMKIMSGPKPTFWSATRCRSRISRRERWCTTSSCEPGKGGQMGRAAGSEVRLISKEGGYALLRLPSGEVRRVLVDCMATIGQVGNVDHSEHLARQGRPDALAGQASAQPRRHDEPGRPPARRRRRQDLGRTQPGDPLGTADARIQDAQQPAHRRVHRGPARPEEDDE